MTFQEAVDLTKQMNISEEDSLTFRAAVILLMGLSLHWDLDKIEQETGYCSKDINFVINNLKQNQVLKEGIVYADIYDEKNGWIEFILIAMCGAGELVRYEEPDKQEVMTKNKTLNEHLFDQLERLSTANSDNIDLEINKAASIISVSEQILNVARLKLNIIQANVNIGEEFEEIDKPHTKELTAAPVPELIDSDKKKLSA